MTIDQTRVDLVHPPSGAPTPDVASSLPSSPKPTLSGRRLSRSVQRFVHYLSIATLVERRNGRFTSAAWQSPIVALFAIGAGLCYIIPSAAITSTSGFVVGLSIVAVATLWAAVGLRVPSVRNLVVVVPLLDFIAVGVLRSASGGTSSIFSVLAIPPLVWVATRAGARHIWYASGGVLISVLLPTLVGGDYLQNPSELIRSLFVAATYTFAASVVHTVSSYARKRYALLKARDAARVKDLSEGAHAQQALLPGNLTTIGEYDLAGVCLPAKAVGGDFYDWYETPDGFAVTLGDVMGKGVGAGIIAATARAVGRSARAEPDPVAALRRVEDCLSLELSNVEPFVTLFHARFDAASGTFEYADAGHGLSLILRADGTWSRLYNGDLPLGLGFPTNWAAIRTALAPGEAVITFSDGLLDAFGGLDDSIDQIARVLLRSSKLASAADMVDAVVAEACFERQMDDVTVVVVRRHDVG